MLYDNRQFYIDGAWVDPIEAKEFKVINPATEASAGVISMGGPKDVDRAVAAARRAFDSYSRSTPAERLALMERILVAYKAHYDEIAQAISTEMGAPMSLAKGSQTRIGVGHISAMIEVLKTFKFEEMRGNVRLVQEPVGVCALITPWNWPMNQVAAKVIPALAAGCTMVLKPSEYSPFSAILWAKVMHEAKVPAGVFNLINGDGQAWARRCPRTAKSTWCHSPDRRAPAPRSRAAPRRPSNECTRNSAENRRMCCSTTRTLSAPSSKACCTSSRIPASPATRRRACWCLPAKWPTWRPSPSVSPKPWSWWAIRLPRRPPSVRSSPNCNSTASRDISRRVSPKARTSLPAAPDGRTDCPRATSSSRRFSRMCATT
jgi:hypothetical protein